MRPCLGTGAQSFFCENYSLPKSQSVPETVGFAMPLLALAAAALAAKTNAQRDGLAAEALARALARKLRGSPWVLPATLRVRFKTPGGLRLTLSVGGQLAVDAIARMTGKMKAVFAVRGALQAAIGTHRCAFFVFI